MLRYLVPLSIFAVLAAFFYRGLSLNPGYVPSPLLGKPAPEFELPRLKDAGRRWATRILTARWRC